jgi:hypothetical protein
MVKLYPNMPCNVVDSASLDLTNINHVAIYMAQNLNVLDKQGIKQDWMNRCIVVKKANDDAYPKKWFEHIICQSLAQYRHYYLD